MSQSPMAALTGVESPPLRLPGSHFTAAMVFLVLGAVGLVVVVPDLAAGAFLSPRVTAVTHLFTLGWITTSIMGALYQLLPVALEREVSWPRVAQATLALHAPGLLVFVSGLATHRPGWTASGAALVATGLLMFAANLAVTLRWAPRRDLTWTALVLADVYLVLTVLLGIALALNLGWPFLGAMRTVALAVHLHVALVGWVLLVVVGVGHKLLPMFLLSHGADPQPGRWAVGLLSGGTALLFALHHAPEPWMRAVAAPVLLAGAVAFLLQASSFYRNRRRPDLDPGMRSVAGSLGTLGLAAVLGGVLTVTGFDSPRMATAYVSALVLSISLFVAAHYFKIVPFLVWYHRYAPQAGRGPVPTVAQLYSAGAAAWAGFLLAGGVLFLVGGVAAGSEVPVRVGALLFLSGTIVEASQMLVLGGRGAR